MVVGGEGPVSRFAAEEFPIIITSPPSPMRTACAKRQRSRLQTTTFVANATHTAAILATARQTTSYNFGCARASASRPTLAAQTAKAVTTATLATALVLTSLIRLYIHLPFLRLLRP